jgi:hypothetical protein
MNVCLYAMCTRSCQGYCYPSYSQRQPAEKWKLDTACDETSPSDTPPCCVTAHTARRK